MSRRDCCRVLFGKLSWAGVVTPVVWLGIGKRPGGGGGGVNRCLASLTTTSPSRLVFLVFTYVNRTPYLAKSGSRTWVTIPLFRGLGLVKWNVDELGNLYWQEGVGLTGAMISVYGVERSS